MDFVEGLPKSGGLNALWVVVDRLTKFAHFIPLSHPYLANLLAELFVKHVFKLHEIPTSIISDRDPTFTNKLWNEFFTIQGV